MSRHVYQALDAPLAYKLPIALIDIATIRAFSDEEMLEVARESIHSKMLPSPERLWRCIKETPANERERSFGPYLTKAFAEFMAKKSMLG